MQLRITLRLLTGDHLIGCISEEALQAAEERIGYAMSDTYFWYR